MSVSSSLTLKLNCASDSYPDVYVTDLNLSHTKSKLGSTLSNDFMMIHDLEQMTSVFSNQIHKKTINCIQSSKYEDAIWFSCSSDKTWKMIDTRIPKQFSVLSYSCQDEINSFALSFNDNLIAMAHSSSVTFIDIRKGTSNNHNSSNQKLQQQSMKVGFYEDIHSDQIHSLKFSPSSPNLLLTSSEDGLICTHDTRIADAEECTISTLNIDCPVRTFGFFGLNNDGIYGLTTIETMSIWHNSSAQKLSSFDAIRQDFQNIDYLVNCFESNTANTNTTTTTTSNDKNMTNINRNNSIFQEEEGTKEEEKEEEEESELLLVAGSYSGQVQLLSISPNPVQPLVLKKVFDAASSHSGVIRACIPLLHHHHHHHQMITGGEDGLIHINSY